MRPWSPSLPTARRAPAPLHVHEPGDRARDGGCLVAGGPPPSPPILGPFRAPSEGEECPPEAAPTCRSIVLYRKNLARFARDRRELDEQVRLTLRHEIGHLHGETDDELRGHGLE